MALLARTLLGLLVVASLLSPLVPAGPVGASVPIGLTPAGGTVYGLRIQFGWDPTATFDVPGLVTYTVEAKPAFSSSFRTICATTATRCLAYVGDLSDGPFVWRVAAKDPSGAVARSAEATFGKERMVDGPGPHNVGQPSPANGATVQGGRVLLQWASWAPSGALYTPPVIINGRLDHPCFSLEPVCEISVPPESYVEWRADWDDQENWIYHPGLVWSFTTGPACEVDFDPVRVPVGCS